MSICKLHPELKGRRHAGGNCPECAKTTKAVYRAANLEQIKESQRHYRVKNRERLLEMGREWRAANKARIRANNLKRIGFTPDLFDRAVALQGGRCGICRASLSDLPAKQVHADHCHTTLAARGVLCHHCNAGLGAFRDSPDLLNRAVKYLARPTLSDTEGDTP